MTELETLKKKIIYRSNYRGTKEMDILLSSFVKTYINKLSLIDLKDLYSFLNLEDEAIFKFYKNGNFAGELKDNYITNLFKNFKV